MKRPGDIDDTTRLVSGLLDSCLAPDERARLELLLETDAEVRRLYLQMVDQEIELACLIAPDRDRTPEVLSPVIEARRQLTRTPWRLYAGWWIAAAAAIVLSAVFWPRHVPVPVMPVMPEAPAWSADFESGTATGWIGEIVSEGMPAGSKFGIRAVDQTSDGAVSSQIQLPADWERGLFSLTPRSTLHITCRRATSGGWLDVFMHTDSGNPGARQNSMFMLPQGSFPGEAGKWLTVSLPFSQFVRKVPNPATGALEFTGGAPRDGERVLALIFSGSPGFDIVMDHIWITDDGPDTPTIEPPQ